MGERKILRLEMVNVSQDLGLGMVGVEDWVSEIFGGTEKGGLWGLVSKLLCDLDKLDILLLWRELTEDGEDILEILLLNSLIHSNSNPALVEHSQIDALLLDCP
jgi:hypothetical protein